MTDALDGHSDSFVKSKKSSKRGKLYDLRRIYFFSGSKSKEFPFEEKYLKYLPQSSWSAMYSTDGSEQLKSARKRKRKIVNMECRIEKG